jgi:hypothetical protein
MNLNSKIRIFFSVILFAAAFLVMPTFAFIPKIFSDTKDKFYEKLKVSKDKTAEIFSDELTLLSMNSK